MGGNLENSCQRGWLSGICRVEKILGVYFEPQQTGLTRLFFTSHRGWAGVRSGLGRIPLPPTQGQDPWLPAGSVLKGWESGLCVRCSLGPPEGSSGACLGLPVSILGRFEQWFSTPADSVPLFIFNYFLMPPFHLEVKLMANKTYHSKQ